MKNNWLEPNWEPGLSITKLPIEHLLEIGVKALILDVDGTLLPKNELIVDRSVMLWIEDAKKHFKLHLLSNNPSKKRIENISDQININFTYKAAKPSRRSLRQVLKSLQLKPPKIAIIGDKIFTDVLGGNRLGLYSVLVHPLGPNGEPCKGNKRQRIEKRIAGLFGANDS